jgi:hypothetical protein
MKNTWKVAVAAAALVGTASVARADLTLDGQTGLFTNPTAEIVKKGAPEVQVNYDRLSAEGEHLSDIGVGFAFSPVDKLELSANTNRISVEGEHIATSRLGLKYQFVNQADKGLDVAAGLNYGNFEGLDQWTLYAAATKGFKISHNLAPVKGTLGVRWDRFSEYTLSESKGSIYGGVEVPLTRDGRFSLTGELGSKVFDYSQSTYAIGLRYHPKSSGFSVGAGYGRIANTGIGLLASAEGVGYHNFFIQAGYTFGK